MAKFSKENAAEMGRKGQAAMRARPNRTTRNFRQFAESILTDPQVQKRILVDARARPTEATIPQHWFPLGSRRRDNTSIL